MSLSDDTRQLADALHDLAKLYQFRSLDQPLYRNLTVSQSYCLRILCFQGPRKMSSLAEDLKVRLSTMTGVIDQLEAKGLVERAKHPRDRRSIQVQLTAKGKELYQRANDAFLSHLVPVLESQKPAERKRLLAFLDEVTVAVHGWMENPRKVRRHAERYS